MQIESELLHISLSLLNTTKLNINSSLCIKRFYVIASKYENFTNDIELHM